MPPVRDLRRSQDVFGVLGQLRCPEVDEPGVEVVLGAAVVAVVDREHRVASRGGTDAAPWEDVHLAPGRTEELATDRIDIGHGHTVPASRSLASCSISCETRRSTWWVSTSRPSPSAVHRSLTTMRRCWA